MIYLIGKATESSPQFTQGKWEDFQRWIEQRIEFEYDVETIPAKAMCDRKLRTIQFGDARDQWVFQWTELVHPAHLDYIKHILESQRWKKLIHNALFECIIMLFYDVRIQNIFDTMLAEQVLYGGEHTLVGYGLDDVCWRRMGITLDKSYQTAFGENILTPGHIVYAAQDVKYLSLLKKEIYQDCQCYGLEWTVALECEVVSAFAEISYHGMELDQEWWIKLQDTAEPLVSASQEKLNNWLKTPEFSFMAYDLDYIRDQDNILINWNSGKQKSKIFSELFPELPGTTKAVVKKYISDKLKAGQDVSEWLYYYVDGDTEPLTQFLLKEHREWLIENQLLIPAGVCTINWNSVAQVLPIMQCVEKVKDLSAKSLGRTSHPIVLDYEEFKDTSKLITSFGEQFILKWVEPDGKVRTSFNLVMTTGRVSSKEPNMQQIPAKESVGNKYRNAFVPPVGWSFVSSDYVSQELILIAYLSGDPVWKEALSKGQDLHSIAAEMVYGKKWKDAAEKTCEYYFSHVDKWGKLWPANSHLKCSCHKHKYMRTGVKTINFGLAYGMSHFKLAATLRITVPEAKQLIIDYFRAFPGIGKLLDFLGRFGLENGYIQTIWPFYRRRWFPNWKFYTRFIESHIQGAQYHDGLGEIERASKNQPIQGTAADMTKVALCLLYAEIHENGLEDRVRLAMQVHDQVDAYARNDFKEEWAPIQTRLMEEAAKFIIPTGILKAETTITERWSK